MILGLILGPECVYLQLRSSRESCIVCLREYLILIMLNIRSSSKVFNDIFLIKSECLVFKISEYSLERTAFLECSFHVVLVQRTSSRMVLLHTISQTSTPWMLLRHMCHALARKYWYRRGGIHWSEDTWLSWVPWGWVWADCNWSTLLRVKFANQVQRSKHKRKPAWGTRRWVPLSNAWCGVVLGVQEHSNKPSWC